MLGLLLGLNVTSCSKARSSMADGQHAIPGRDLRRQRHYGRVMPLVWEQVLIDAHDPVALGRWWASALGWVVVDETDDEFEIRPSPDELPGLLFGLAPDEKVIKNRLHLDFRPADQRAEVDRLLALGATHADVGQTGDESWTVLADPEGNEFCILGARPRGLAQ
jgi:hypothetical protein